MFFDNVMFLFFVCIMLFGTAFADFLCPIKGWLTNDVSVLKAKDCHIYSFQKELKNMKYFAFVVFIICTTFIHTSAHALGNNKPQTLLELLAYADSAKHLIEDC